MSIFQTIIEKVFRLVPGDQEIKEVSLDERMVRFRETNQGFEGKIEELSHALVIFLEVQTHCVKHLKIPMMPLKILMVWIKNAHNCMRKVFSCGWL